MKRKSAVLIVFGLTVAFAAGSLAAQTSPVPKGADTGIPDRSYKSWSAMPILMYDQDIGVGYGAKAKFVDFLKVNESFDFIFFKSSKGERWYVFTFQIPDIEIRQGKTYKISFDLKAEYDKFLNYNYYGVGMGTREEDVSVLTHETKNLQLTLGRGFTQDFVVEVSYMFRSIDYYDPRAKEGGTYIAPELLSLDKKNAPYASLVLRYDTSDSQLHPTMGFRLLAQDDLAGSFLGSKDASFNRITIDIRKYMNVFGAKDVFAFRTLFQYIGGDSIPLFDLSSLGGGGMMTCMRGFSLNRFLDKGKLLANVEYRFPLWWRIGGNAFVDLGNVWPKLGDIDWGKTAVDAGIGLRLYTNDFVARVDVGFGKEGMGLYFNFGHVF